MPIIVAPTNPPRVVVVQRRATASVQTPARYAVITQAQQSIGTVTASTVAVEVGSRGPQGPKGDPGASGGVLPTITFAFGDASPATAMTLPWRAEIISVSLQIEDAFDGDGASIALGTAADHELLMPAAFNAPGTLGVYETTPRVELPMDTPLMLTISPGAGAAHGRGQFAITAVPIE